jgi:hypothetical protein
MDLILERSLLLVLISIVRDLFREMLLIGLALKPTWRTISWSRGDVLVIERVVFDPISLVGRQLVCKALMSFMLACNKIRMQLMSMSSDGLGVQILFSVFCFPSFYFDVLFYSA